MAMERVNPNSNNLSAAGSFSLHSLAEGSEAISEVDEIHEVTLMIYVSHFLTHSTLH